MDNKLIRYTTGEDRPRGSGERALAKAAKPVYDEVRLTALKIEGATALAAHAMEAARTMDDTRRAIAGNDEVRNQVLAEMELEGIRQVKRLQANLYNKWEL